MTVVRDAIFDTLFDEWRKKRDELALMQTVDIVSDNDYITLSCAVNRTQKLLMFEFATINGESVLITTKVVPLINKTKE